MSKKPHGPKMQTTAAKAAVWLLGEPPHRPTTGQLVIEGRPVGPRMPYAEALVAAMAAQSVCARAEIAALHLAEALAAIRWVLPDGAACGWQMAAPLVIWVNEKWASVSSRDPG